MLMSAKLTAQRGSSPQTGGGMLEESTADLQGGGEKLSSLLAFQNNAPAMTLSPLRWHFMNTGTGRLLTAVA